MLDGTRVRFGERASAFEDRRQAVVFRLLYRIELVIVTANAAKRHPQKRFTCRIKLLVDRVHFEFCAIGLGEDLCTEHKERRRGFCFLIGVGQQVSRQLLD